MANKNLRTDLYQLTMMAAYYDNNINDTATFDFFIRSMPKDWGYFIANGIEDTLDYITNHEFTTKDIDYLRSQDIFSEEFLEHLKDFGFEGEIYAVKEGTPVFPNEPVMRITANIKQVQFYETILENISNFQTMIASKASRVVTAANGAKTSDFGLRRAQEGDAGLKGARACYLAGVDATSNVEAGFEYGIPISGTHAHSWVMNADTEIESFRNYVKTFPNNSTLLIDTYDTEQGARNAVIVAKELVAQGKKLGAVRLDSGDLADLSIKVRQILDAEGLDYVKITASNDLNEYKIEELNARGACIDAYGVGTEMITAKPVAAISGVYKLVQNASGAKIKLSPGKKSLPGKKQIYRQIGKDGKYMRDVITLDTERQTGNPLLELAVSNGQRVRVRPSLEETRSYCLSEVEKLPPHLRQVRVTKQYSVESSHQLDCLVDNLVAKYQTDKAA